MAKNMSSKIELDNGLFGGRRVEKQPAPEKQPADLTKLYSPPAGTRQLGSTQGKKGQKQKRINMAFHDDIHEYIVCESRRRGISATVFVNSIIRGYKDSGEGYVK